MPNRTVSFPPRCGMVSPPARRAQHTHTCSFASRRSFPHLPDLQEMSIRVMEEGPGLVAPLERRGEKLGSARAEDPRRAAEQSGTRMRSIADDTLAVERRRIAHGRLV